LIASVGAAEKPGVEQGQEYAGFERVAWLPAGSERGEIGYQNTPEQPGPEAFWVLEDGTIRVLDTEKNRVVDFRGSTFIREIPLPAGVSGLDMVVGSNGLTYVLSTGIPPRIVAVGTDGKLVDSWRIPPEVAERAFYLEPRREGPPLLVTIDQGEAELDTLAEGGEWSPLYSHMGIERSYSPQRGQARLETGCHTVVVQGKGSLYEVLVWAVDDERNIYVSYLDLADTRRMEGDIVVSKYDEEGKCLGVAAVPEVPLWSWPRRWIHVTHDGAIFLMLPMPEGVAVERVTLGERYESVIEKAEARWREEQKALRESDEDGVAPREFPPDITRSEVNVNCNANIGYDWTYNQENGEPVPEGVTKPDWLRDTPYGTQVEGIPYC